MNKISVAVIGYGNIGKAAAQAVWAAPDMSLCGVVRPTMRDGNPSPELHGAPMVRGITELGEKPDVAILCVPSRAAPDMAAACLEAGICTVDAYDMHAHIPETRIRLDAAAKAAGKSAILACGWDPGSDSIVRALLLAAAPKGITYTDFGPGMSMGHSVAARSHKGVKNALSMTIPLGTSLHRRMVYVELADGCTLDEVAADIKADEYFAHDETHVVAVDSVDALIDMGHGVHMARKGVSGGTHNQLFEFTMKINNPALTAQLMVAAGRAVLKRAPGCYTMIELPVIDLLYGDTEALVRDLV